MLGRDIRTVRQWLKRFYETGKIHVAKTSGRRRKTTRDLDIVFAANENPFRTRLEIRDTSGVDLDLKTISKSLNKMEYIALLP
jgi:transposase